MRPNNTGNNNQTCIFTCYVHFAPLPCVPEDDAADNVVNSTEHGASTYKPRTGRNSQCMNHAPAILAAPALIYSMHCVLVVRIIVAIFTFVVYWEHCLVIPC